MSRYQAQAEAFEKANFAADPKDMHLFNFDFEKALGYHIGKQFYALIPAIQAMANELISLGATSFESKVERNGSDCYVWLESQSDDVLCIGQQTQNMSYLVYVVKKYSRYTLHVRRIWTDFQALSANKDRYLLGVSDWKNIKTPRYEDIIALSNTAASEYSDDIVDSHGKPTAFHVQRPSLRTHSQGIGKHDGMQYLDSRDSGYVVSVGICNLTDVPFCNGSLVSMQAMLSYIYSDLKSFLDYPDIVVD